MFRIISMLLLTFAAYSFVYANLIGNFIEKDLHGYYMNVFDHRAETLKFMNENGLQGGGPTWMGIITAALELESPKTLKQIRFDDEADVVLITSKTKAPLEIVQACVSKLMDDNEFMLRSIGVARGGGYLE